MDQDRQVGARQLFDQVVKPAHRRIGQQNAPLAHRDRSHGVFGRRGSAGCLAALRRADRRRDQGIRAQPIIGTRNDTNLDIAGGHHVQQALGELRGFRQREFRQQQQQVAVRRPRRGIHDPQLSLEGRSHHGWTWPRQKMTAQQSHGTPIAQRTIDLFFQALAQLPDAEDRSQTRRHITVAKDQRRVADRHQIAGTQRVRSLDALAIYARAVAAAKVIKQRAVFPHIDPRVMPRCRLIF
jgi:hypothetical protein